MVVHVRERRRHVRHGRRRVRVTAQIQQRPALPDLRQVAEVHAVRRVGHRTVEHRDRVLVDLLGRRAGCVAEASVVPDRRQRDPRAEEVREDDLRHAPEREQVAGEILGLVRPEQAQRLDRRHRLHPHAVELAPDALVAAGERARVMRRHHPAIHDGRGGKRAAGRRVHLPGAQLVAEQAGHGDVSAGGDLAARRLPEFVDRPLVQLDRALLVVERIRVGGRRVPGRWLGRDEVGAAQQRGRGQREHRAGAGEHPS